MSDQERMDSCRHDSVAANSIYQERDSTSETNKFAALGIKPLTVTPDPVTPSNKKLHYYKKLALPSTPQTETTSIPSTKFSMTNPTELSLTQPTDNFFLPKMHFLV